MAKKKKGGNKNEWKITDIVTILILLLVGYLFILMFSVEKENKGEEVNVGIKLPNWLSQRNTLPKYVKPRGTYNV